MFRLVRAAARAACSQKSKDVQVESAVGSCTATDVNMDGVRAPGSQTGHLHADKDLRASRGDAHEATGGTSTQAKHASGNADRSRVSPSGRGRTRAM